MKASLLLFVALTLLLAAPASAEFYKFVDKNGNIRFTDDLTMIPPEQRRKLEIYEEAAPAEPSEAASTDRDLPPEQPEEVSRQAPAETVGVTEEELGEMKKQLDEKKAALAEEYNALMEERKALESRRREYRSRGRTDEYEDAIDRLNEKNAAYKKKRQQFEAEVKSYNDLNRRYFEAARQAAEQQ